MNSELSIVIVAKNAAGTITRAATSAHACGAYPVLLVDDHSDDETTAIAQGVLGDKLTVVKTAQSMGVGNARQTALENITTPYGMWLDADDELLPDRADNMIKALWAGADLVFDPVMLFDGKTGADIKELPIPDFIRENGGIWRSFERNWIPMLAGGFRTGLARQVGYDLSFLRAEDYDFLLRGLMAGAAVTLLDDVGYRYAHSPHSLSRDLASSQQFTIAAQKKHRLSSLETTLTGTALTDAEKLFTLACVALNRADLVAVKRHTDQLCAITAHVPPYDRETQWMAHYLMASAMMEAGNPEKAFSHLQIIDAASGADSLNNLALICWHLGNRDEAKILWKKAQGLLPNYLDAAQNLAAADSGVPSALTRFPLRRAPSRSGY
ncbi:glycosyltransferase family 2 protein [Kordiimonas aestuarii]|uniref:glycosyltransferase family 2 protein n=1 Tax=Kordiimonas aestuarii TaxID=1005925 RepID=UPI0021CE56D1|nr:glycosyltransferase [Kordiimonas aestuarii]